MHVCVVPELQQHLDPSRGEKMALAPEVMAEIVLAGATYYCLVIND